MLRVKIAGYSVELSKEEILARLPESLLADALHLDFGLTELQIASSDVDTEALKCIANYLQGIEPGTPIPSLIQADRYLNLPSLMPYFNPDIFKIPNRNNINSQENKAYLEQALKEDRVLVIQYALQHGFHVKQD